MSELELSQFYQFGCASRCIIRLSNKSGKSLETDQFIARYSHLFEEGYFGRLSLDELCFVTKDLGLCLHLDATSHLQDVVGSLERKMRVFLLTSYELDAGLKPKGVVRHIRLIEGVQSDPYHGFPILTVWNPLKDGTDVEERIVLYRLEREGGFYLIPLSFGSLMLEAKHC